MKYVPTVAKVVQNMAIITPFKLFFKTAGIPKAKVKITNNKIKIRPGAPLVIVVVETLSNASLKTSKSNIKLTSLLFLYHVDSP